MSNIHRCLIKLVLLTTLGLPLSAFAQSEDYLPLTKAEKGKNKNVCKPVSWYASFAVVVDEPEGRRIASLSASSEALKTLLDHVVSKKYNVAAYGQRREDACSPELLWAQPAAMIERK